MGCFEHAADNCSNVTDPHRRRRIASIMCAHPWSSRIAKTISSHFFVGRFFFFFSDFACFTAAVSFKCVQSGQSIQLNAIFGKTCLSLSPLKIIGPLYLYKPTINTQTTMITKCLYFNKDHSAAHICLFVSAAQHKKRVSALYIHVVCGL